MSEPAHEPIHYPESNGQPLAETEIHVLELLGLMHTLRQHYRDASDVYFGANMFVYYEQGNPRGVFAPDVFVTLGVPKRVRRTYKLWEEGRPPTFVMEISSDSTWFEDTGNKKALCARLGVREYFLFDPNGDYLEPRLQGFRLQGRDYERIASRADGSVESEALGVRFSAEGTKLCCVDAKTGAQWSGFVMSSPSAARNAARHGFVATGRSDYQSRASTRWVNHSGARAPLGDRRLRDQK